jgi:hypothetical protein
VIAPRFGVNLPSCFTASLRAIYSKLDHTLTGSTNAGDVSAFAGYRVVF